MENCFVLVIPHREVALTTFKLLLDHRKIILLQGVEKRKGAVVVWGVRPWIYLINDVDSPSHTDNMFYCSSFEILLASSFEILVRPHQPTEDLLISVACASKQTVFSESILHLKRCNLLLCKDVKQYLVLTCFYS